MKYNTRVVRFTGEDRSHTKPLTACKNITDLKERLKTEARRMKDISLEQPFISMMARERLTGEASAYLRVAEMIRKLEINKVLNRSGKTVAYRHTKIEMPSGVTHILEIANSLAQGAAD